MRIADVNWGSVDRRSNLGTHPTYPDIIFRRFPKPSCFLARRVRSREESIANFAAAQQEYQVLRSLGVCVVGAIATHEPGEYGYWTTLMQTPRLEGVKADPQNPDHIPQLLRLAKSLHTYINTAYERERHLGDVYRLDQYTYGHTAGSVQPPRIYLHDIEPFLQALPCSPSVYFTPEHAAGDVHKWASNLPSSNEHDEILHGLSTISARAGL